MQNNILFRRLQLNIILVVVVAVAAKICLIVLRKTILSCLTGKNTCSFRVRRSDPLRNSEMLVSFTVSLA